ncbi:DUF1501 domain-containing protein [Catellatospora sp. KI3]|uniref:DUF1501 domain-containing protein n=1 Tax=Catellatospora sp. KI3 TaxID=3041620 RepID=UPI002482F895|nr:DUF1501 domain-containing protein [Catellatospora sp. KI3]MDI1463752.1 DUF1501 domain-containing protein [Catellatospora sp. KI3]
MDAVTRRKFLIASGVVGGAALVAGAGAYTLHDILATADHPTGGPGDRTLVLVTLYGGNDGLATVIPYADRAYRDARADLAYDTDEVLRLDAETGLNPAMTGMKSLYDRKQLAIVRGVGYPKPDRSHFRSMDIWQTANPVRPVNTGWLGRWLDHAGRDPRSAISLEPVLPPVLAGATCAGAAVPLGGVSVPKSITDADLKALGAASAGESSLQARAAACFADLISVDKLVTDARDADDDDPDHGDDPATGTGGAQATLQAQLDLVARCVEAGVMTRVFSVSQGGFDFHAEARTGQEIQLKTVDAAVSGFLDRMARTERGRKVVVVIYSEFGRRVRANSSDGTDHGTASDMLIAGPAVNGGRLVGDQPSLTDLDDGDLKFHTDFRDVYAAILTDVLGADPDPVLEGWSGRLGGLLHSA